MSYSAQSSKKSSLMMWMSGLATRVINCSTRNGSSIFSFRHISRWLLISDCRYFWKPTSGFLLQWYQVAGGEALMVVAAGVCSPGLSVLGTGFELVEWLSECVHLIATLHAQLLLRCHHTIPKVNDDISVCS